MNDAQVDFIVKFGRTTVEFTVPITSTMSEVKNILAERTQVPTEKQRLLFNAPVVKEQRRDAADNLPLKDLFPAQFVERVRTNNGVPQHVKVSAMLLGSSTEAPMIDSKVSSEISRLVATTVEHDGQWFRCCYSKGYLRQTAYVCRTCVQEGRADPQHAVCLACAEICHGNHEVEEWGVRYNMRCDCCTEKCWRPVAVGSKGDVAAKLRKAKSAPPPLAVTTTDVEQRTRRKRSRSSSPLTPKRTNAGGGSPMSGVRVAAVANGPSPFSLQDPSLVAANRPPVLATDASFPQLPASHAATTTAAAPEQAQSNEESPVVSGRTSAGAQQVSQSQQQQGASAQADGPPPSQYPEVSRCVFLVDSKTNQPPENAVIPANSKNRYPRKSLTWCYCEDDNPTDDPDCGGIVCMLCTSCFWSIHMTRLYTDQYRRMPCYGDVVQGELVAFKCVTCNTLVCAPCRLRCHKDHEIAPELINPSPEEKTDNGAPAGAKFSCGCRGLCSIAESVPAEEVDDRSLYMTMPNDVAEEVMNSDVFMGVICAHCMQQHPWLMTEDPAKCYKGQLPAPVTEGIKPLLKCSDKRELEDIPEDVFPYHGMLLPVNSFTEEITCTCGPCRDAYEAFAPRADEDATEMVIGLHDQCDNCGSSLKDRQAFMCKTCEMTLERTFFICKDCNAKREELVLARQPTIEPRGPGTTTTTAAGTSSPAPSPAAAASTEAKYEHDLTHEFIEDTFENLYALCHMQMMQTLDEPAREYLQEHWEDVREEFTLANTLTTTFGQIPLNFSEEEMRAMGEANLANKKKTDKDEKK